MIRWLFFVAGVALLALVVHRAGPGRIAGDVASQGWVILPFILLSAAESALHALSCLRCMTPAHRGSISSVRMFLLYHLAFAINLVTPTGDVGGDVARGIAMRRHVPTAEAASSILVNKVSFSIVRILLAAGLAGAAVVGLPMDARGGWAVGLGSALTLTGLLLFGLLQARGVLGPTLVRLARAGGRKRQEWMRAHAAELDAALGSFYANHRRDLAVSVAFDLAGFLVGIVQRCFVLAALIGPGTLPPSRLLLAGAGIWGISNLVDVVFFFVMGRLGVREGGYQAAFEAVGLPGVKGLSMSVVDRVDQLFWMLLGLGVYWAYVLRPAPGAAAMVPAPEEAPQ